VLAAVVSGLDWHRFNKSPLVGWCHLLQTLHIVAVTYVDPILSRRYTEAQDAIIDTEHLASLGFLTFTLCKKCSKIDS
jgi:hypothetical protein